MASPAPQSNAKVYARGEATVVYGHPKRLALVAAASLAVTCIICLLTTCLFRGFCAADAETSTSAGRRMTFSAYASGGFVPAAIVLLVVVSPLSWLATYLVRPGLTLLAAIATVASAALLLGTGIGVGAMGTSAASMAASMWERLTPAQRLVYGSSLSQLEAEVRADMTAVVVPAFVAGALCVILAVLHARGLALQLAAWRRALAFTAATLTLDAPVAGAPAAAGGGTGVEKANVAVGSADALVQPLGWWRPSPIAYLEDTAFGQLQQRRALWIALGLVPLQQADGRTPAGGGCCWRAATCTWLPDCCGCSTLPAIEFSSRQRGGTDAWGAGGGALVRWPAGAQPQAQPPAAATAQPAAPVAGAPSAWGAAGVSAAGAPAAVPAPGGAAAPRVVAQPLGPSWATSMGALPAQAPAPQQTQGVAAGQEAPAAASGQVPAAPAASAAPAGPAAAPAPGAAGAGQWGAPAAGGWGAPAQPPAATMSNRWGAPR